jgi:hypothetical protein
MKMTVFGLLRRVFWQKSTDVSEVLAAYIIRATIARQPDYTVQQLRDNHLHKKER